MRQFAAYSSSKFHCHYIQCSVKIKSDMRKGVKNHDNLCKKKKSDVFILNRYGFNCSIVDFFK